MTISVARPSGREGMARGAVEGDEGGGEDQQGRRGGREVAAQAQQQGGLLRRGLEAEQALRRCKSCFLHASTNG